MPKELKIVLLMTAKFWGTLIFPIWNSSFGADGAVVYNLNLLNDLEPQLLSSVLLFFPHLF